MDELKNEDFSRGTQDAVSQPKFSIVFIVLFLTLILLGISYTAVSVSKKRLPQPTPLSTSKPLSLSPHTIVYGYWFANNSYIRALDLSSGKEYLLAVLPLNVKKVSVLSPDTLVYIASTNAQDHGTEIALYSLFEKKSRSLVKTENGFVIDDYVLSPNKAYLATWEVSLRSGSTTLSGGRSRVYGVNLQNPSAKYLIYDEVASAPVHYPRAVTDTGEIFLDTFLPNSGAGWAYGMSVSSLDGTRKEDINALQNGTYGTQPVLSSDGKYLAFAGYDGSLGAGTDTSEKNTRRALITTNTIELLDTQSKTRTRLPNIPNSNIYRAIQWDETGDNLFFSTISLSNQSVELYVYNLAAKIMQKVPLEKGLKTQVAFLASLSQNTILVGSQSVSISTLGNLGDAYSPPITAFFVFNMSTFGSSPLNLSGGFKQYITVVPSSYFQGLGALEDRERSDKNIQLGSFVVKPMLSEQRVSQQSDRVPLVPPAPPPQPQSPYGPISKSKPPITCDFNASLVPCFCLSGAQLAAPPGDSKECTDSPLYLYGPSGNKIEVKVETPIISSEIPVDNLYSPVLGTHGELFVNGKNYESIDFNYVPAVLPSPPPYGIITTKNKLKDTLSLFAKNLGLNQKETDDLLEFGDKNIDAPYTLVSFYDEDTSKKILPLSFNPRPDTYINIVFYFKLFDSQPLFTPTPPQFKPIVNRGPFTAVEISEIVDRW